MVTTAQRPASSAAHAPPGPAPGPRDKVFPERQRCQACRCSLSVQVVWGRFCGYRCAQMPVPPSDPSLAHRQCVTVRDNQQVFKRRYTHRGLIPATLLADPSTNAYWCDSCGYLHIGHSRVSVTPEQFVVLDRSDPVSDLGRALVKLRGSATHKQVAAAAGVRPIRLLELETGVAHPENLATLAAVLRVYRVGLGLDLGRWVQAQTKR